MRVGSVAVAGAALSLALSLGGPVQAKTAYQHWAQGRGAYVSSKDHPPFELQGFLVGGEYGGYAPPLPPGGYYPREVPPYGYDAQDD